MEQNKSEITPLTPEEYYEQNNGSPEFKNICIAFTNAYLQHLKNVKLKQLIAKTENMIQETESELLQIKEEREKIRKIKAEILCDKNGK